MIYSLRIFLVGIGHLLRGRFPPADTVDQTRRAWPHLCDQNLHLNNASYLTLMDYGRVAWVVRAGLAGALLRRQVSVVAVGVGVTYRRELRWWSRFRLQTRLCAHDDRWFYIEQCFVDSRGRPAAHAWVRMVVRDRSGRRALADVLRDAGNPVEPQAPGPELAAWIEAADATVARMKPVEPPDESV